MCVCVCVWVDVFVYAIMAFHVISRTHRKQCSAVLSRFLPSASFSSLRLTIHPTIHGAFPFIYFHSHDKIVLKIGILV